MSKRLAGIIGCKDKSKPTKQKHAHKKKWISSVFYPTVFTAENGQRRGLKNIKTTNGMGAVTSFLGRPIQFLIVLLIVIQKLQKVETSHPLASTAGFELGTVAVT